MNMWNHFLLSKEDVPLLDQSLYKIGLWEIWLLSLHPIINWGNESNEMSQMTKMDTFSVTTFWRFIYFMHLILWIISINPKATTQGSCVDERYVQFQNKTMICNSRNSKINNNRVWILQFVINSSVCNCQIKVE